MSALLSFEFEQNPFRIVMIGETPWFVANDLATVLGYAQAAFMTRILDEDEKGLHTVQTLGGPQVMSLISEGGMYHAAFKSRKEAAVRFRKWVTADLLPTLRKTGRYEMPGRPALPDAAQLMQDHDTTRISVALNVVREARKLFGPQSARLMWMNMGLPAPVASEAPLLFADPMGPELQAFCETVNECTIEDAASALGITHLDGGMRVRIGKLLRELGWFPLKARRGGRPVNLFAPRHTIEREAA